ncbi:MAG TPA: DUF1003 domain-containing protein, partial [Caulobacteraceae bacterium]|nr:DUF1003 domain-containing protein [Caulobacteraceae bacterium]
LPDHIETTIRAITDMHARHQRRATPSQRAFSILAQLMTRPRYLAVLTLFIAGWILANLFAARLGLRAWDPAPFNWLQGIVSAAALYTTAVILIAQRREDELGALREQLTLELAILGEQKSAKTIELIEQLRRDLPSAPDRDDPEASAMSKPADPLTVADALIEANEAVVVVAVEEEVEGNGA